MLGLAVVALALLFVGFALQCRLRLFEYVFFCRFPLLTALTLAVLLPGGMFVFGKSFLGNLADVNYPGMFWVAFVVTLTAWTVMFASALVMRLVPERLGQQLERNSGAQDGLLSTLSNWFPPTRFIGEKLSPAIVWLRDVTKGNGAIKRSRLLLYHALTWWLLAGTAWTSSRTLENGALSTNATELLANAALTLAGVGAALLLRFAAIRVNAYFGFTKTLTTEVMKRAPQTEPGLWQGGGFFVLLFIAYLVGWVCWEPGGVGPPLLPFLAALNVVCLGLTMIALWLDESRVGVLFGLAMTIFVCFSIANIDHYYVLLPRGPTAVSASSEEDLTPRTVACQWRRAHADDPNPTMVIVTASGGASTAAYWTATVLRELQTQNESFAESIVLLSTASGGGVGMMYFVDAFDNGSLQEKALKRAWRHSGESSLLSTVWGLAYEDLFAFVPRPWMERRDRGWALEETWKLRIDDSSATLRGWKRDVLSGWRPVPIFNATVAETGERFLITPMSVRTTKPKDYFNNLPPASGSPTPSMTSRGVPGTKLWDAKLFFDLYPESDLHVATAARLSATFPFVSPIPQPTGGDATDDNAFHIVDGGYYDNHGVVSAIDFLRDVIPQYDGIARECGNRSEPGATPTVLIVQIRAGEPDERTPKDRDGFSWATIGPLKALLNVRTTSQISRNDSQLELLFAEMRGTANLHTVVFDLDGEDLPFSWHLSEVDRERIAASWDRQPNELVAAVNELLE